MEREEYGFNGVSCKACSRSNTILPGLKNGKIKRINDQSIQREQKFMIDFDLKFRITGFTLAEPTREIT